MPSTSRIRRSPGRWNQAAGDPIVEELRIASYARGDNGIFARHGFQNRVRHAFGKRREHETIETSQEVRHVRAIAGKPRPVAKPCRSQHAVDAFEQRSATGHDEPHARTRRMPPHVLLDAVTSATGVATSFTDYPNIKRAVQLPNEQGQSAFLDMFGRSRRATPCECETSLSLPGPLPADSIQASSAIRRDSSPLHLPDQVGRPD